MLITLKLVLIKKIVLNAAANGIVSLTFKSKSVLWSYGDPMELEEFDYKLHAEHWTIYGNSSLCGKISIALFNSRKNLCL